MRWNAHPGIYLRVLLVQVTKYAKVLCVTVCLSALMLKATGCHFGETRRPAGWKDTMLHLSSSLYCAYLNDGTSPYDVRGEEYALYDLLMWVSDNPLFWRRYEEGRCMPFSLDPEDEKATDLRVHYINQALPLDPESQSPVVVLVRDLGLRLYTNKRNRLGFLVRKSPPEGKDELVFIASNCRVYSAMLKVGTLGEATDILGLTVMEVSDLCGPLTKWPDYEDGYKRLIEDQCAQNSSDARLNASSR